MTLPLTPYLSGDHSLLQWECAVVSVSQQGYESFEEKDKLAVEWLNTQLQVRLEDTKREPIGGECYHLKGRGGVKKAIKDLQTLLDCGDYPYVIRSDAKGYYAHIRHHKLIGMLKDYGFSREVCHVTTQLCQRMVVRGGIYSECRQGIPLGCAASPALAAIYLSPLDNAMGAIAGVQYIRYMDDWIILCPSRWKMRRAVKLMHQTLSKLGQHVHPDKTFIGKSSKGFDFLGVQFSPVEIPRCSEKTKQRLQLKLTQKFAHAARLYEQGRLHSLESIELYLTHWLRWSKGIGIASPAALDAIICDLHERWLTTTNVMHEYFSQSLIDWAKTKTIKNNENTQKMRHHRRSFSSQFWV